MKKTNKVFRLNAFILLVFIMTFGFAFNAMLKSFHREQKTLKLHI